MKKCNLVFDAARCTGCPNCVVATQDEYQGNSFPGYAAQMPPHTRPWVAIERKERGQYPVIAFQTLKQISLFAWIPMLSMWFGLGDGAKVAFIAMAGFFPMVLNTFEGLRSVPREFIEVGRVYGFGLWQQLTRVIAPSAAPSVFTGVQLALIYSWLATLGSAQAADFYERDGTTLGFNMDGMAGAFSTREDYLGEGGKQWREAFMHGVLVGKTHAGNGELYGGLGAIAQGTWGDGDAGGYTNGRERDVDLEDAYLGEEEIRGQGRTRSALSVLSAREMSLKSQGRGAPGIGRLSALADGHAAVLE